MLSGLSARRGGDLRRGSGISRPGSKIGAGGHHDVGNGLGQSLLLLHQERADGTEAVPAFPVCCRFHFGVVGGWV